MSEQATCLTSRGGRPALTATAHFVVRRVVSRVRQNVWPGPAGNCMASPAHMRLEMPDREPWSAYPGRRATLEGAEVVILVPPGASQRVGFEMARREIAKGNPTVRVIGRGITLTESWPAWVQDDVAGLRLTELDAYLPSDRTPLTTDLAEDLREWLAEVFDGAIDGVVAEHALWASAMRRVFVPAFATWPLVLGLAHHHGRDSIFCTDPNWIGNDALADLVRASGGTFTNRKRRSTGVAFPLRLAFWMAISAGAAIGVRGHEFWKERPSREELRKLRAGNRANPGVWIGVIGDWPRSSRHVVQTVGKAARLRGEPIGVLLQSTLQPGLRTEDDVRGHTGSEVFPSLHDPAIEGNVAAVDQCASVETVAALVANAASSIARSIRVFGRLVQHGGSLKLGEMPIDLSVRAQALARLSTFDVLRGNEVTRATHAFLRRGDRTGARVVWSHASLTTMAVPDLIVQEAGIVTYDLAHGSMYHQMDLVTTERTHSSMKAVWTEAEARIYAPVTSHQKSVGGYMPRTRLPKHRPPRARQRGEPIRILALTNYACGDSNEEEPLRMECYQRGFFEALSAAVRSSVGPVEVRWRPHPSDSRLRVDATARLNAAMNMGLSLDPNGLTRELAWADVLVTSISSSIVEAVDYSVPILVHDIPIFDPAGVLSFFAPERRFRHAEDLSAKLRTCIEALESSSPDALRPELALERELFGPGRQPKALDELLWPQALSAAVAS